MPLLFSILWYLVNLMVAPLMNNVRVLVISLMLLAFVGQAVASAIMPFQMDMSQSGISTSMDTHSGHHEMNQMDKTDVAGLFDCCKHDSNCSMAGCSAALVNETALGLGVEPSQPVFAPLMTLQSRYFSSLFRPPITR